MQLLAELRFPARFEDSQPRDLCVLAVTQFPNNSGHKFVYFFSGSGGRYFRFVGQPAYQAVHTGREYNGTVPDPSLPASLRARKSFTD